MAQKILLVDDEEMILDSLKTILAKEGYQVDCARNGGEALSILQDRSYDLVITDIRMPVLNGIDMVDRIMESDAPKPKIMMITGYGSLETAVKAQHRGVIDYLIKPIDAQSLKRTIRRALETQTDDTRQLDSKLRGWAEYITLISDFTASMNASLDMREIINATADRLGKIAETERRSLRLYPDVIGELYYIKNFRNISSAWGGKGVCSYAGDTLRWIEKPLLISAQEASEKSENDIRYMSIRDAMKEWGLRFAFLIPVLIKGRVVGLVDVSTDRQGPFTEMDMEIFKTLVSQSSLALGNAFSYLEMEERSKEIGLLYNLSLRLNQSLKITDSIKAICEGAVDVTGAEGSLLQTSLQPGSIKNFIFQKDLGFHKEMKRGTQDWLIPSSARKQAFISNDPVMDPRVNSLALYSLGIRSLAYVPLIYEWEDLGGLTVFNKSEGRKFDQRDLNLLHLYARHASEVLLNSQLFEAIKKSREKVIAEKNKMDIVLSNMADGVVNVSPDGRITYINTSMLRMLGIKEEEALGRKCAEVFRMKRCADCPVRKGEIAFNALNSFEDVVAGEKNDPIPILVSIVPTSDANGKVSGWIKVIRNMDKAREIEQLKESIFHALAHDLRNPLTALTGFVEMFSMQSDMPEKYRPHLKTMFKSAMDMDAIITNLLDIYRNKNVKFTVKFEEVDIHELARSALTEIEGAAQLRGISVSDDGSEEGVRARADSDLIKRVLNNLLNNAIKFTPAGGNVRIKTKTVRNSEDEDEGPTTASRNPAVQVSVEDSGGGVPHGDLDKIFDAFYRAKSNGDAHRSGTGLGLAISKEIVEAHGGRIWAENIREGGTRFSFTIPN